MSQPWKLLFEWWLQLWPNMFAVSVWTTGLLIWNHSRLKKQINLRHNQMKAHITAEHNQTRLEGRQDGS